MPEQSGLTTGESNTVELTPVYALVHLSTTISNPPTTHTGEPWSGWDYWLLLILLAIAGLAALALTRRRAVA